MRQDKTIQDKRGTEKKRGGGRMGGEKRGEEGGKKRYTDWEIKLSLFTDYMIVCVENPKKSTTKTPWKLWSDYSKIVWHKVNL